MQVGDKIRYVGHTAKCKSCVDAGKPIYPQPIVYGVLDDADGFGETSFHPTWEWRIGKTGVVTGVSLTEPDMISIQLVDEDSNCYAYVDHLEVIK